MKKLIFILTGAALLTGTVFTSCDTITEKAGIVKINAEEVKEDLNKANEDFKVDIENFKKETAAKIDSNKQKIAELNVKIEYAKKDAKAYSQEQVAILEQKNKEMKLKMDTYKEDGKENWERFKSEFSRDMDNLGEAFKNFTVKSK
ncbi:MAG: peptidase M23 [Flavobacteriaceae bacterium]|nr:peptidase M23 [Flavobacteriaceae bacterium]